MGRVDGGPYIKSPSNGKFIEVDAERGDYVLTTDVMGYVANTYDMYIAYAHTYPLLKHQKCPSELLRGFLSNFKDYLEE